MQTVSMMNKKTILAMITILPTTAGTIMIMKLVVGALFNVGDE